MKSLRYQIPAFTWAIIIFLSSSIPGTSPLLKPFAGHDKIVHTIVYFSLAFLTHRALKYQSRFPSIARHAMLLSLLFAVLYGAADELHQLFVPSRSADIRDFMVDALGAVTCLLLLALAGLLRKRRSVRATPVP